MVKSKPANCGSRTVARKEKKVYGFEARQHGPLRPSRYNVHVRQLFNFGLLALRTLTLPMGELFDLGIFWGLIFSSTSSCGDAAPHPDGPLTVTASGSRCGANWAYGNPIEGGGPTGLLPTRRGLSTVTLILIKKNDYPVIV